MGEVLALSQCFFNVQLRRTSDICQPGINGTHSHIICHAPREECKTCHHERIQKASQNNSFDKYTKQLTDVKQLDGSSQKRFGKAEIKVKRDSGVTVRLRDLPLRYKADQAPSPPLARMQTFLPTPHKGRACATG